MRRRVFSVLMVLASCLAMMAETYVVVMKDVLGPAFDFALAGWEYQGLAFVTDKGANADGTMPGYYPSMGEVRLYPFNTLSIKFEREITSVQFALSDKGVERLPELAVSSGQIVDPAANPLCWEGCSKEITFTVGELAKYGSTPYPEYASGQLDFLSITLTVKAASDNGNTDPGQEGGDQGQDSGDPGQGGDDPGQGSDNPGTGSDDPGNSDHDAMDSVYGDPLDNCNVQYFTLQGVKIAAPIPGQPCIAILDGYSRKILK